MTNQVFFCSKCIKLSEEGDMNKVIAGLLEDLRKVKHPAGVSSDLLLCCFSTIGQGYTPCFKCRHNIIDYLVAQNILLGFCNKYLLNDVYDEEYESEIKKYLSTRGPRDYLQILDFMGCLQDYNKRTYISELITNMYVRKIIKHDVGSISNPTYTL